MSKYKIEKGIPVSGSRGQWTRLAESMMVGDSVKIESENRATSLYYAIKRSGFDSKMRALNGEDKGKYRVWKLKKEIKR